MASAGGFQSEEHLRCLICLNVFTEPISIPCGHNFCRSCITDFWASCDVHRCPLCHQTFDKPPRMRVDQELRDDVEAFRRASGDVAQSWKVSCDLCRHRALKSCLVCLVSYCDQHLQPHQSAQPLKWHKLMDPVESLKDRVCSKHNKLKEFFCREEQICVCAVCTKDEHATHETVATQDESVARRAEVKRMKAKVDRDVSDKIAKEESMQKSKRHRHLMMQKAKAETERCFGSLILSIRLRQVELMKLLEEKQEAEERQDKELIGRLQLEIDSKRRVGAKLEELLNTKDDFQLLQELPSASSPSGSTSFDTTVQSFLPMEALRRAVTKTEETFSQQMDNIMMDLEGDKPTDSQTVFDDELRRIQQQYAITVTLDANTAHPALIVSPDGTQVMDRFQKRKVPDNVSRFDCLHYVLGNEGFSSGRFYYEVKSTSRQTGWEVRVVRDSVGKKGIDLSLSPEDGCWTLGLYWGRPQANTNPPKILSLSKDLDKIGVFVDYEEGLVSFYDINARALIYSFTGCVFTVGQKIEEGFGNNLFQFRRSCCTPNSVNTKIYPIFRPSFYPLQITVVSRGK
uniref:Uncharacterized protein n=1 Tax=Amphiprion percula TaxID=161767 RepID=A0A3P8U4Y3_AMPPE